MKQPHIYRSILVWFIAGLLLLSHSEGKGQPFDLLSDDVVVRIAAVHGVKNIRTEGSLEKLAVDNRLVLKVDRFDSSVGAFKALGIKMNEIEFIEGIGINGWAVNRYRVSSGFDIIVEHRAQKIDPSFGVSTAFIVPHSPRKYQIRLFTPRRWSEIEFPLKREIDERR